MTLTSMPRSLPLPASVTALWSGEFEGFDATTTLRQCFGRWAADQDNKYYQLIQYLQLVEGKTSPAACQDAIAELWAANGAAQAQRGTDSSGR